MRFPVQELRPAGGELYAHVFENPSVGVSRNLFWNLRVEFAPVELDGEERDCSLACEWLVWPIRRWTDLSGLGIADVLHPEQVETSFYLAEHSPARLHELRVTRVHGAEFDVHISATFRFDEFSGVDENDIRIETTARITFSGVIVVPANLFPKPSSPREAAMVAADFLDFEHLKPPDWDRFRFVLRPTD